MVSYLKNGGSIFKGGVSNLICIIFLKTILLASILLISLNKVSFQN
jgi:hypothetical protein